MKKIRVTKWYMVSATAKNGERVAMVVTHYTGELARYKAYKSFTKKGGSWHGMFHNKYVTGRRLFASFCIIHRVRVKLLRVPDLSFSTQLEDMRNYLINKGGVFGPPSTTMMSHKFIPGELP